ncbi:MAG: hypothetical protein IPG02_12990 [Ignavibacteria bacterium]|nr:hypothetical protein [Ignavibacteria bacterium]
MAIVKIPRMISELYFSDACATFNPTYHGKVRLNKSFSSIEYVLVCVIRKVGIYISADTEILK